MIVVAGLIGAITLLTIVQNPFGPLSFILVGIITIAVLCKAWLVTRRDPIWLAFVLMLFELLSPCFFLTDRIRPIASYGLTLLFCFPAIPIIWQVWKGRSSGFKLYLIYFGWCLITITYSLAPLFSIARMVRSLLFFSAITMCSLQAKEAGAIQRLLRSLMLACIVVTLATAATAVVLPHSVTWGAVVQQNGSSMNSEDQDEEAVDRFQGPFDGPSRLGELALVTVGLILTYFEYATRKERIVLGSIAILAVGLEGLADSRSSFVALAIGCGLYACWRYRLKGLLAVTAVSGLAVLGLMFVGNNPYIWRGDVWTVTGRVDMWPFVLQQIAHKPITGYGYAVGGAIFDSRYFPVWWGPYNEGPRSSIHNGYLQHMVEVGIPATMFWLFIVLRPWFALFRQTDDRSRIKRILFFVVIPLLLVNLDEEMLGDGAGPSGFLFAMVWAVAEQHRLAAIYHAAMARRQALRDLPGAAAALRFAEFIR
jgi:hypothetical protein